VDYLGLFCLGAFVGAIATIGIRFIENLDNWAKVLGLVLPAVLSGVAVVFVDKFKYSPALGCYPLGLLVSLLWAYSDRAVANIQSEKSYSVRLGYAHLTGAITITFAAGLVVTLPAVWQLQDEYRRPSGDTLKQYEREQVRDTAKQSAIAKSTPSPAAN
jgi:hypothetical protein